MLASHCCKVLCDGKVLRNELMSRCIIPCSAHVPAANLLRDSDTKRPKIVHRCFYTEACFCTGCFYTRGLLHRDAFHKDIFLYTHVCTLRCFCPRCLYTQKYLYAEVLLHSDVFTRGNFYTQIRRYIYTQMLLHRHAFLQECFYTCAFTRGFF